VQAQEGSPRQPKPNRVRYLGESYHPLSHGCGATSIVSRGVGRKDLYVDDANRQRFLKALADARHNGTNPSASSPDSSITDYFDWTS
jgi:hypothetical protein